jgi:hypothetical protein
VSGRGISPRLLAFVVVAVVVAFVLVGWFGVVSPQRSKAGTLDSKIAETQAQLQTAKVLNGVEQTAKGKRSGVYMLGVAMPQSLQMPIVLRQVQSLATSSNVSLNSFAPSSASTLNGYDAVPISVQVTGRYDAVKGFLRKLRVAAGSTNGHIHATGRLYDVSNVSLSPGGTGAVPNQLTAAIQLAVFIFTGTAPPPPATTTTTDTTGGTG